MHTHTHTQITPGLTKETEGKERAECLKGCPGSRSTPPCRAATDPNHRVSVTDMVRNVTARINTASTHQAEVHMHTRQASARRHEQTAGATQIRYFAVHAS